VIVNKPIVLITGSNGLLGKQLRVLLEKNNFFIIATSLGADRLTSHTHKYLELDIECPKKCNYVLNKYKPSIIINTAAMTNVDECEKKQKKCFHINTNSIRNFIPYVDTNNTHFIQISTDMVFDGKKGNYNEEDICSPINFYGTSKLAAESIVLSNMPTCTILRTSLLYAAAGDNFLTWTRNKLINNIPLNIVDDQYRTPTYVYDLAMAILQVIECKKYGLYHISSGENLSIFDIVCNIAKHLKQDSTLVNKIKSIELNQIANRPMDSSLSINKAEKDFDFIPTTLNHALKQIL